MLGRLAVVCADYLRGKHKTTYTPHMDCGDHIVVVNAEKVHLTGKKLDDKIHYWHTGYPGGIKQITARATLEGKHPERLLERAVKRMIPKGPAWPPANGPSVPLFRRRAPARRTAAGGA